MFGPREVLLTSENPVITQFVNGRRIGPIGMSEEKDEATLALEKAASLRDGEPLTVGSPALMPQLVPTPGLPERQAVQRRMDRVMSILPTLPTAAQQAILADIAGTGQQAGPAPASGPATASDPERERAQAQARAEAWRLAREREAAQREAEQETAEQERPGRWPPDWPGGSG
jgi:phospholipid/cholesterol/gamma-HCH transport system ATP-binding protein